MTSNWKKISTIWEGDKVFIGSNASGGTVTTGSTTDGSILSPMELLLVGVAGCTGVDVVGILKKKRVSLSDFKINVLGKRASTHPKIYTEIEVEYLFWSEDLVAKDAEQAIMLSKDKYCPASAILGKTAKLTSTYKIFEPGESGA
jgi:putative redox protein